MIMSLLTGLVAKVFGLFAVLGIIAAGAAEVTGSSPRSVFNTILNIVGAGFAVVVTQIVRDLRAKTEEGDTPAAQISSEVREVVIDLKQVVLDLRGELLHNRRDDDPPSQVDQRPNRTS